MTRLLPLAVLLLLAGCFVRAPDGYSDDDGSYGAVSVDTFGPSLDPYGAWVVVPGYGRAWQPALRYVGPDFYPYGTGGRWLYTNAGWVFDSDYPFGWAVFHYGRWYHDFSSGWLWLPGRTWAPSWVSWRAGGPYVGWAPLGPRGVPGYDDWCFIPTDWFTVGHPRRYSLGAREYHRAVAATEPLRARSRVPVGPPPSYVSSATRERIVPVPLTQVPSAGRTPPPPSSGRANAPIPPPPPGALQSERRQGERFSAPPPPRRMEPERRQPEGYPVPPPPRRMEPERRQPESFPPPARMEPERGRGERFSTPPAPAIPRPERREQPSLGAPPPPPPSSSTPSQPVQRPSKRNPRAAPPPPPPRR